MKDYIAEIHSKRNGITTKIIDSDCASDVINYLHGTRYNVSAMDTVIVTEQGTGHLCAVYVPGKTFLAEGES